MDVIRRRVKTDGALIEMIIDMKMYKTMAAEASFRILRVFTGYFGLSLFNEEFSSSCSFNHPKLFFFFIGNF